LHERKVYHGGTREPLTKRSTYGIHEVSDIEETALSIWS